MFGDFKIMQFHAHVFFELNECEKAERLRLLLEERLGGCIQIGPFLNRPAGPLPKPMFQLEYSAEHSEKVREVLEEIREGQPVLIHPVMEDELAAHTQWATWLGPQMTLRLENL